MSQGERRLAAVMFTDVVGFTSLAQSDELQALRVLDDHRKVIRRIFPTFGGVEVKTVGDAFLLEFMSSRDAVLCAVEIQSRLHEWNSQRPPSGRISVRVGIHLGDVVHTEGDVYGDAVNVASRLEALAEPGGVCISMQVYESIRNKTGLEFVPLGEKELKNVQRLMEVYRIKMPWEESAGGKRAGTEGEAGGAPVCEHEPRPERRVLRRRPHRGADRKTVTDQRTRGHR